MKKFEFSPKSGATDQQIFMGSVFYNIYKDSEFLRNSENVETILSKGYELRQMLKNLQPGQVVAVDGVWLEKNKPLLVKKTGDKVIVENYEFTANRLSGLVAAYAFDNRLRFPMLNSSEALSLGLVWNNEDTETCKIFLSAVSGTEHFYEQFQFWPLFCALRKLQLKKITLEPVVKMAKIKNPQGIRMGKEFIANLDIIKKQWHRFDKSTKSEMIQLLKTLPPELKKCFFAS